MALEFISSLQNLWPLSIFKYDDLKASNELVSKLSIPEQTKRFVYAVRDKESQSVIYILSVQNLSERSAVDAERLIRAVRPEAVVLQVDSSAVSEHLLKEEEYGHNVDDPVPTSSFDVIKRCFFSKINKDDYESVAGNLVLYEIFGVGFYGHVGTAKKAAAEVGSLFLFLGTPSVQISSVDNPSNETDMRSKILSIISCLVQKKAGPIVPSSSWRFRLKDDNQSQMVKKLSLHLDASLQKLGPSCLVPEASSNVIDLGANYQVPPYARSVFPLLLDLYNIFIDIPSIGRALAASQKLFYDVSRGESVETQIISDVYTFRIAVEGLRIALNNAGRLPISSLGKSKKTEVEFSELPLEDKSSALLAQSLKSQTSKFKNTVALVEAGGLAGLRKHWNTPLPPEVKDLVSPLVTNCDNETDGEISNQRDKKRLISDKPVVAVGAGATAVLGASSLSKAVPTSTFLKAVTFKLPAALNLALTHSQKAMAIALSKAVGPSKVIAPGLANSGANATSFLKTAASAEKIRAVAHSVIASVEKTSFSAMRTAFYQIMRNRRVQPIGFLPVLTFGCSISTCMGLLMYGDGIECAAESLPAAPSIASLGRGIQNLQLASQELGKTDGNRIQKAIESLMYRLRKVKVQ